MKIQIKPKCKLIHKKDDPKYFCIVGTHTKDQEAPEGSQRGRVLELLIEVLPDEHDDAEVRVDPVRDEERREDEKPGGGGGQDALHLQREQDGEDQEAHQPDPDLKDGDAQPSE